MVCASIWGGWVVINNDAVVMVLRLSQLHNGSSKLYLGLEESSDSLFSSDSI